MDVDLPFELGPAPKFKAPPPKTNKPKLIPKSRRLQIKAAEEKAALEKEREQRAALEKENEEKETLPSYEKSTDAENDLPQDELVVTHDGFDIDDEFTPTIPTPRTSVLSPASPRENTSGLVNAPMTVPEDDQLLTIEAYAEQFLSHTYLVSRFNTVTVDTKKLISREAYREREVARGLHVFTSKSDGKNANKIWKLVCSFLGDYSSVKGELDILMALLLMGYTLKAKLRDEMFMTIIKQLNGLNQMDVNDVMVIEAGWRLMDALLNRFGPTPEFAPYFGQFLQDSLARAHEDSNAPTFICFCLDSLQFHLEHPNTFHAYGEENFKNSITTSNAATALIGIDPADLYLYSTSLKQPLLMGFDKKSGKPAVKIFKAIASHVNPDKKNRDEMSTIVKILTDESARGGNLQLLVDESYCQLLKMSQGKTSQPLATLRSFELLHKLFAFTKPTPHLLFTVITHLQICNRIPSTNDAVKEAIATILPELVAAYEELEE